VNKSLDIKPQYSDNLNTFFDHEKNIENLPGPEQHLSEDDNLLSNEGSGPGGNSAGNTTISS